jgi:hypothetical protein
VRQAWQAQAFRPFGDELPQAVQGAINIWHDVYGGVLFVTIGKRRAAYHRWIGEGVALRFDEETRKCVGFVVITGMVHTHDTILPLWATLLMMSDAIVVNATID